MSESELFRILHAAGVTVTPAPDGMIDATGPLTDALRQVIQSHKARIRLALEAQGIGELDDPPWTDPRRYVIPASCIAPMACYRLGPCGPPATLGRCDGSVPSATT
jgi:hypothetical protein